MQDEALQNIISTDPAVLNDCIRELKYEIILVKEQRDKLTSLLRKAVIEIKRANGNLDRTREEIEDTLNTIE